MIEIQGKMRKVELLPTRDCEAGYAPETLVTQEDSGVASLRVYPGGLCGILPGRILTCGRNYSVHDVVGS